MQPEKMSPEDLEFELSQALSDKRAAKVRAHIAAVEAERDEADSQRIAANTTMQSVDNELRALRERVEALETELNAARAMAWSAKERGDGFKEWKDSAESRLAAIRQRAGDEDALAMGASGTHPDVFAALTDRERADWRTVGRNVARYVVGEDAAGAEAKNPCCDVRGGHIDACYAVTASTEPSTVEAFATLREFVAFVASMAKGHRTTQDDARAALSMLERRMGAMGRALREVKHRLQNPITFSGVDAEREIDAALADAPPVFTLEEVERVVSPYLGELSTIEVLRALSALRGK